MPLEPGSSRAVIGRNIAKEESAGKPEKQAVAIAMNKAGMSKDAVPVSSYSTARDCGPEMSIADIKAASTQYGPRYGQK